MNIAAAANEHLAHASNVLVYTAITVYTLAFIAHIAEWALGSRSRVARTSAALTTEDAAADAAGAAADPDGATAGTAPAAAARARPATAKVAVRVGGEGDGSTTVLERPKIIVRSAAGSRDVPDGPGAAGGDEQGDMYGRIAIGLTWLAFMVHVGGVVLRALSVQRAPWGNMYEFSTTFSAVAVAAYFVLLALGKNVRWMGLPLITTVLLDLGLAVSVLYTSSDQLVPALHSYWLWIHVSCAIISGAVLYMGAVATLLYLFRDRYEERLTAGGPAGRLDSVLERLPAAASLDKFAYRVNAAIFPLWTFTIIAGSIWAEAAWGHYWEWDPKETWSFITWVGYACYLHARATAGWKGRKAAYLALIAFACFLFNYYGVNIFVSGKHSYAGV